MHDTASDIDICYMILGLLATWYLVIDTWSDIDTCDIMWYNDNCDNKNNDNCDNNDNDNDNDFKLWYLRK